MSDSKYSNSDVLLISACRTPIGRFCGSLATLPAHVMGGCVISECIKRAQLQFSSISNKNELLSKIRNVVMGQVFTAGAGQNPARRASVAAGLPYSVPAWSLNMVCASGLKAVCECALEIKSDGGIAIAGGQESMSQCPHITPNGCSLRYAGGGGNATKLTPFGDFRLVDSLLVDGLEDAFSSSHMGATAEIIARRYKISREEQDIFALQSQMKCREAVQKGLFISEIAPIVLPSKNQESPVLVDVDECPRPQTKLEKLRSLRPAFTKNLSPDECGTVTAGNSSTLSDGAAACLLCCSDTAETCGVICPLCRVVGWHQVGCDPEIMGLGPVDAIRGLLKKLSWNVEDVELFELNEAFAVQSIAVIRELSLPIEKVNVSGGAIALGHPLGCSGARILVTLAYNLHLRAHACVSECNSLANTSKPPTTLRGVAALCVGGGMGIAVGVEVLCARLSAECPILLTSSSISLPPN